MSLTSNSDCITKQTFCALNKEAVQDNDIKLLFPEIIQNKTIAMHDFFDKIRETFKNINKYGNLGTRNPTDSEIASVKGDDLENFILAKEYNAIMKILGKDLISVNEEIFITKQMIDKLQDYIKTYKLNPDRCNFCNVSGNCGQSCGQSYGQGCVGECWQCYQDCKQWSYIGGGAYICYAGQGQSVKNNTVITGHSIPTNSSCVAADGGGSSSGRKH